MSNWKSVLNDDPVDWLLEEDNPSVKYFTLTEILDKKQDCSEVQEAKEQIMKIGLVPKILSKQNKKGYWGIPKDFYIRSKYKGTVWTFIILAELRADGSDNRIRMTCEFVLENSQDRESGGFAYYSSKNGGGSHSKVIPCLTGNMIWCLICFGYLNDPRVQHGIKWINRYQRFDDGIEETPKGWPYDKREPCWGRHTCHMGIVKTLKALAEIPVDKRSTDVKNTIKKGAEYLLKHHVYKRSHKLDQISKPSWLKFGFPLMWQTDALEITKILTKLGYRDKRMNEAINLIISKQDSSGRWNLERTFNGRYLVTIEQKGKTSKWVTLNALKALKSFYNNKKL